MFEVGWCQEVEVVRFFSGLASLFTFSLGGADGGASAGLLAPSSGRPPFFPCNVWRIEASSKGKEVSWKCLKTCHPAAAAAAESKCQDLGNVKHIPITGSLRNCFQNLWFPYHSYHECIVCTKTHNFEKTFVCTHEAGSERGRRLAKCGVSHSNQVCLLHWTWADNGFRFEPGQTTVLTRPVSKLNASHLKQNHGEFYVLSYVFWKLQTKKDITVKHTETSIHLIKKLFYVASIGTL